MELLFGSFQSFLKPAERDLLEFYFAAVCSGTGHSGQSEGGVSNAPGTRSVRVNAQRLSRSCCKLSPVKIPSPQLAAPRPGSPRMIDCRTVDFVAR